MSRAWLTSLAIGVVLTSCDAEVFVFDEDSGFPSVSASSCSGDGGGCPLDTLHCDPTSGQCFECVGNSDCLTAQAGVCDPTMHRCVQCEGAQDCGSGETCELSTLQCVPNCPDGGECPGTLTCSSERHLCLGCNDDGDCVEDAGARKVCNRPSGKCVECFLDQQCSGETPVCNVTQGECVQCLSWEDCTIARPVCDPVAHQCVQVEP